MKHLGIENRKLVRIVQSKWHDFTNFTLFPEVKEVLTGLQQRGVKLGLVSTGYEEAIHRDLRKLTLDTSIFDIIVGVDTAQCMKPHPDPFTYALKKLKVQPGEALFVGDDLEADYHGAKNVGMHALLLDRTETQKQSDLRTIQNLREVPSQIT